MERYRMEGKEGRKERQTDGEADYLRRIPYS